jgi:hypothetical protein
VALSCPSCLYYITRYTFHEIAITVTVVLRSIHVVTVIRNCLACPYDSDTIKNMFHEGAINGVLRGIHWHVVAIVINCQWGRERKRVKRQSCDSQVTN